MLYFSNLFQSSYHLVAMCVVFCFSMYRLPTTSIIVMDLKTNTICITSVSKKMGQLWNWNFDYGMSFLANYYLIFQMSHAKTFKMTHTRCLNNNPIQNIHENTGSAIRNWYKVKTWLDQMFWQIYQKHVQGLP